MVLISISKKNKKINIQSVTFSYDMIYRGTDVSIENLHQGFTHIFEATFETLEGRSAYVAHPAHVKFGTALFPALEKVVVIDYVPKA